MEASAKLRYLRASPRKVRLVADQVRGKPVGTALSQLKFSPKRAARPLAKLLESAVANALSQDPNLDPDTLWVKTLRVDGGPIGWKIMPRAMGRAYWVSKRTSHIEVVLTDAERA
ncbi:MAG: 50S ribosomal protein L22 [Deltaproteobacteria bacterium]|nr:MAG: 50S ribosomal protein L22 [Deltaproteobacteria bacterium]